MNTITYKKLMSDFGENLNGKLCAFQYEFEKYVPTADLTPYSKQESPIEMARRKIFGRWNEEKQGIESIDGEFISINNIEIIVAKKIDINDLI